MSNWARWIEEKPKEGNLVLVHFGEFEGYGLRTLIGEELYDEHEFLDDSEITPKLWHPLPK